MNFITLEAVLRKIHNLPSLPAVVRELAAILDKEDANIDALARKIGQDQALAAKTLRLANSSFYGMAHRVTTLQEAIAILGFRTVRSLGTTSALMGAFAGSTPAGFNAAPFWRHAIAAAVCARELAARLSLNPEQAYATGLLHDIGRLVLATQFQSSYEATMTYRSAHDCHLLQAERTVLGLDHAAVGQALTRHWHFPETMQQAVAGHHAVDIAGASPLTLVILAADAMAHALDLSSHPDDLVPPVPAGLWAQLGLNEKRLLAVLAETEKQFAGASLVLNS
jgi:putative nucleotidyltransferase with HDIG domain